MNDALNQYLTRAELARELRVKGQTLAAMACRGEGPAYVKVGRSVRYRRADVEAWIAGRMQNVQVMAAG